MDAPATGQVALLCLQLCQAEDGLSTLKSPELDLDRSYPRQLIPLEI